MQPPKPGAREPRADHARDAGRDLHQRVELRRADPEQVAHRRVALREQPPDRREVARLERRDRVEHPLVLVDDVLRAGGDERVEPGPRRLEHRRGHVAQRASRRAPSRRSPRPPPRTASAARCTPTTRACAASPSGTRPARATGSASGIARCSRLRQSSRSAWPAGPEDRRELVHDPVVEADEPVLGPLDGEDEVHRVGRRRLAARERPRRRHLERRRRREARRPAAGPRRAPRRTRAARARDRASPRRCPRRSPATCPRLDPVLATSSSPVSPVSASVSRTRPSSVGIERDRDPEVDRDREHEALVVVGVLADQVHAPGRVDHPDVARPGGGGLGDPRQALGEGPRVAGEARGLGIGGERRHARSLPSRPRRPEARGRRPGSAGSPGRRPAPSSSGDIDASGSTADHVARHREAHRAASSASAARSGGVRHGDRAWRGRAAGPRSSSRRAIAGRHGVRRRGADDAQSRAAGRPAGPTARARTGRTARPAPRAARRRRAAGRAPRRVDRELIAATNSRCFGAEVVVDERRVHARRPRAICADRGAVVAALAERRPRRVEDPPAACPPSPVGGPSAGRPGSHDVPADRERGDDGEQRRDAGEHERGRPGAPGTREVGALDEHLAQRRRPRSGAA